MATKTVNGFYGLGTPCSVFVYETRHGNWYCVEGSSNVNFTAEDINDGVDVENVSDSDCFYHRQGIHSLEELVNAVDN